MDTPGKSNKKSKAKSRDLGSVNSSWQEDSFVQQQQVAGKDTDSGVNVSAGISADDSGKGRFTLGFIGNLRAYLISSSDYVKPYAEVTFLPVNPEDFSRLTEYAKQLAEKVSVNSGDLARLINNREGMESSDEPPLVIPYQLKEPSEYQDGLGNELYFSLAVFPSRDGLWEKMKSVIGRLFIDPQVSRCERMAFLLTSYFSGNEGEKTRALLEALKEAVYLKLSDSKLSEIYFITAEEQYRSSLINYFNPKPQKLEGDLVSGTDRLNVENEASALADVISLREMQPPISLAVMGGWGSGKSSVMKLIQKRLHAIRSYGLKPSQTWPGETDENREKLSPFAGHIYQVELNAWDYAKSNLWASLMYRIFYCLNDQMAKEKFIANYLSDNKRNEGSKEDGYLKESLLWEALSMNEKDLKILLDDLEMNKLQNDLLNIHNQDEFRNYLWNSLAKSRARITVNLERTRHEIADKKLEVYKAREKLDAMIDNQVTIHASRSHLLLPLKDKFISLLGKFGNTLFNRVNSIPFTDKPSEEINLFEAFDINFWQKIKLNKLEIIGFLVFTALSCAVPLLNQWAGELKLSGYALGVLSLISAGVRTYTKVKSRLSECYDGYIEQLDRVKKEVVLDRDAVKEKILVQLQKESASDPNVIPILSLSGNEKKLAELLASEKRQKDLIGITADYETLTDFLNSRLSDGSYERELGLMHQVKKDLEHLTEGLRDKRTLFPRGPARIVLFVDDLDRCPPQRVVEVLEATQLLLRTELFVVVMAIDVRYIVKALEKYYDKILVRGGRPSALDYIEKIIQIPYRVRSVDPDAVGSYLRWQMSVETTGKKNGSVTVTPGEGTGGTIPGKKEEKIQSRKDTRQFSELAIQEVKFTEPEVKAWEACCKEVPDLTPREIKRLVNVAKILKLVWFREGITQPDEVKQVIFYLLTLSERFPDLMRDILSELSRQVVNPLQIMTLKSFFQDYQLTKYNHFMADELKSLQKLVKSSSMIPDTFSLAGFDFKTLDLVRCFCFVGDVGYDPGDEKQEKKEPTQALH